MRNFDFRNYKRATLQRRIERRMTATGCRNRSAYLALLERDPNEVSPLVSSMLIKLTTFFRDKEVWGALDKVLAERVQRRRPNQEVRIWSAGCATGEEAYSVAIAVGEALGPGYLARSCRSANAEPVHGVRRHLARGRHHHRGQPPRGRRPLHPHLPDSPRPQAR